MRKWWIASLIAVPLVSGLVGGCCGGVWLDLVPLSWVSGSEVEYPLPHHVPKYPGNVSLRFAMVHDVIHERFPHHGPDFYKARNREVRAALDKLHPTENGQQADEYFRLVDDLGVGLEFLGEHKAAVHLMRDKLTQQEKFGYTGRELYSSYANLGTFLILWQLGEGLGDVKAAKERITESVQWIHKAIDVYQQSHFGRESWQVVLEEFLLAVLDEPGLLLRFDMVGDDLRSSDVGHGHACHKKAWEMLTERVAGHKSISFLDDPEREKSVDDSLRKTCRDCITRVGADEGWETASKTCLKDSVPFDEPALGIIGMWRMGAGANPHFTLALGEIMLRVGQRHIAWTAYERAFRLHEHFWADPWFCEKFAEHCRWRQRLIEKEEPDEDWQKVRQTFETELAFGQNYQKEYEEYESQRIADGVRTDDPHFYDDFDAAHEPIATAPGSEETMVMRFKGRDSTYLWPYVILIAGFVAFIAAGVQYSRLRARQVGKTGNRFGKSSGESSTWPKLP